MDLDGGAVAAKLASIVNPSITSEKPARFDQGIQSGYIGDAMPRVVLTKAGRIENACTGNDVRFDVFISLDFTVPKSNVLRGSLSFDIEKNGWDVAKCLGLTMLNPLSIFVTMISHGQLGIGIVELATSFVFPTKAIAVFAAMGALIIGFDQAIAEAIIADRLKDKPNVTKLPDGGFSFDKTLAPHSGLTRDWLVLTQCTGSGSRMLLTGEFNVPNAVLPQLTAADLEGLSKWILFDRCEPGKGQITTGSLALSLLPGYGADLASVKPVRYPTIPIKGAMAPDGSTFVLQVLNDHLGIYSSGSQVEGGQISEYWIIRVNIPGLVEVMLKASTIRKKRFETFAEFPYPLRIRILTNGGVREYEFIAPPKLEEFTETLAEAAERINNCKHRGSSLVLKKYLELKWRVDPPLERNKFAQQWEVHIRGLQPGRVATVWNYDTAKLLMRAFADNSERIDIGLILRDDERTSSLLIGLDDEPFLSRREMHGQSVMNEPKVQEVLPVEVAIRQTRLTEIEHLEFDESIDNISFADSNAQSLLEVRTSSGSKFSHSISSMSNAGLSISTMSSNALESTARRGLLTWRGKERQFTILSQESGRQDVLAEYSARSSYDLTANRNDLLAQVSSDGRGITLFRKGIAMEFGTHEWVDASGEKA